jgi:ABC-type phosphate transport system ATPase subunit
LHTLELTNLQDLQVGSDAAGGLSFEQKKRLSIAVEVAANPSVLFLVSPRSLWLQQAFYAIEVKNQSLTSFLFYRVFCHPG